MKLTTSIKPILLTLLILIFISKTLTTSSSAEPEKKSNPNLKSESASGSEIIITPEKIEALKSISTFEVMEYNSHPFKNLTRWEITLKLGLLPSLDSRTNNAEIVYGPIDPYLPEQFNYKEKWPKCFHTIRDQGNCGSCWAFAASEVLSDRFCIASNSRINEVLSPQDLVSCDSRDRGCAGGFVNKSWDYLKNTGIVAEKCYPYFAGDSGASGICPFGSEPSLNFCKEGKFKKYKASAHAQITSISEAKKALVDEGPIESGFNVFEDFLSYKSGIYRRVSDNYVGGHAVKVVGYGKDNDGTEYWVAANSWNTSWGEEGFFRIAFGEAGFESSLWAGQPDLTSFYMENK